MRTLLASLVAVFSVNAAAQQVPQLPAMPDFDVSRLDVNSAEAGSLVVGTGEMLPAGALQFSLAGHYENSPLLSIDEDGQIQGSLLSDRYTIHMVGGWAPFDWLTVMADVPLIAAQFGDASSQGIELVRRGIGSPTGIVRAGLLSQAKGSFADVALQLGVRVPVGTDGAFANDGRIGLSPKLMIGRNLLNMFRAGVEVGARWREGAGLLPDGAGNELLLAGVLSTGTRGGLQGELSARSSVTFEGRMGAVELLAGARYPIGLMELWVLAGPGLGQQQSPGTPAWRVLVGANFGNGLGLGAPVSGSAAPVQGGELTPRTPTDIPSTPIPQASAAPASTAPSVTVPVGGATVQAGASGVTATGTVPANVPVAGGTTVQVGTSGISATGPGGVSVQSGAGGTTLNVPVGGTTVTATDTGVGAGGHTVPTGGSVVLPASGGGGAKTAPAGGTTGKSAPAPSATEEPNAAAAPTSQRRWTEGTGYANPYGTGSTGTTAGSTTEEAATRPAPTAR